MTSESRKWLRCADADRQWISDSGSGKARDPKDRLWRGTESWWELDERRDLVGSWHCRRSERYGGRQLCKALKVKVASLNRIRHLIGSWWSCLRSSFEDSGDVRYCWYTRQPELCMLDSLKTSCELKWNAIAYRIEFKNGPSARK